MTTHYEARGNWIESRPYSTEGRWDICYADILTQLIKSCGKYCEKYASDLFIDWQIIVELLEEGKEIDETRIFAIRDYGVDHKEYYEIKMNNKEMYPETYHEVWELIIKGDVAKRDITMELNLIAN